MIVTKGFEISSLRSKNLTQQMMAIDDPLARVADAAVLLELGGAVTVLGHGLEPAPVLFADAVEVGAPQRLAAVVARLRAAVAVGHARAHRAPAHAAALRVGRRRRQQQHNGHQRHGRGGGAHQLLLLPPGRHYIDDGVGVFVCVDLDQGLALVIFSS